MQQPDNKQISAAGKIFGSALRYILVKVCDRSDGERWDRPALKKKDSTSLNWHRLI